MSDSEVADLDDEVVQRFFSGLRKSGISNNDITLIADNPDAVRGFAYLLNTVLLQDLRIKEGKRQRNALLLSDASTLQLNEDVLGKLQGAMFGAVFRVALANRQTLLGLGLSDEEILQITDALRSAGLEGIREDGIDMPEQILRLWHTWNNVPTSVRTFYGI